MNKNLKKVFLGISIALPFLIYCVYYYSMMIRNAPYKFSEFQSIKFEYGTDDSLLNKWDSRTGEYQYLDAHDSLIKKHIHIRNDDLLYLHRKAAELGFWNFPNREVNDFLKVRGIKSTHYVMQFNYKRKSKTVVFDEAFDGDPKLKDANEQMIKIIEKVLADEENKEISAK